MIAASTLVRSLSCLKLTATKEFAEVKAPSSDSGLPVYSALYDLLRKPMRGFMFGRNLVTPGTTISREVKRSMPDGLAYLHGSSSLIIYLHALTRAMTGLLLNSSYSTVTCLLKQTHCSTSCPSKYLSSPSFAHSLSYFAGTTSLRPLAS
jgi:hypothetical protein